MKLIIIKNPSSLKIYRLREVIGSLLTDCGQRLVYNSTVLPFMPYAYRVSRICYVYSGYAST